MRLCFAKCFTFISGSKDSLTKKTTHYKQTIPIFNRQIFTLISVCDKCGGKLYQRNDDNLEAFQTRYKMYLEKTAPIIEHYKKQNVLHVINGEDTVENIFNAVDEIISNN